MRILALLAVAVWGRTLSAADDIEFFEKRVRPLLAARCCEGSEVDAVFHGSGQQFGDARGVHMERQRNGGRRG